MDCLIRQLVNLNYRRSYLHTSPICRFLPAQDNLEEKEKALISEQKAAFNEIDEKMKHRKTFVRAISKYLKGYRN